MRGTLLTGLATAALLLSGPFAYHAKAAILAPAPMLDGGNAAGIQHVTNVCGSNGCVRVQTQRVIKRPKPGSVAAHHI